MTAGRQAGRVLRADAASTDTGSELAWPGVFSRHFVHKVRPCNASKLRAQGRVFGLAECGAACVPVAPTSGRVRCPTCWPWPA